MRTLRLAVLPVFWLAVSLLFSRHAAAQEPTYFFSIPSLNSPPVRLRATLETSAPSADGRRTVRVRAEPMATAGKRDLFQWDLTVYTDANGRVERAFSRFRRTNGTLTVVELTRLGDEATARYAARDEIIPLGAAPLTLPDLLAFAGKRYDAAKKGRQTFPFISEIGSAGNALQAGNVTLEAAGTDTVTFDGRDVKARRLNVAVDVPGLPATASRTGAILVGPQGETLKVDLDLAWFSFHTEEAAAEREGNDRVLRFAGPLGQIMRIRPDGSGGGYAVAIETKSGQTLMSTWTDAQYRPVRLETKTSDDARMGATITPTQARWQREAGTPVPIPLTGELCLLTHFLATDLWEGDNAAAAAAAPLAVGEKVRETGMPLEVGWMGGFVRTRERLPDVTLPAGRNGEPPVTLRHYRLTVPSEKHIDLWTDGRRLVRWAASDGYLVERSGWEARTASLPAPPPPRPK